MIICLISDTHENTIAIRKAVELIKDIDPHLTIHCGDIISPPVLDEFKGLKMQFVYGNNDGERTGLAKKCELLGFQPITDIFEDEISGKAIAAYHGTSTKILNELIDSEKYDFVFHGHTHELRDETYGRTRIINPGALFSAYRYTFAKLDLVSGELEIFEIKES